jgi:predicted transcriptional regulator
MEQKNKQQLELIASMVPPDVKSVVQQIAKESERSASWVVRKLLEESPRVKTALQAKR